MTRGPAIPFTATLFARRHIPRGRCIAGTWEAFVRNVLSIAPEIAVKESLPGWSPVEYRGNYRTLPNVMRVHALGFDHDRGDLTIAQAAALWADCMGAIHTTWSHTSEAPRLRVILLLSRAVSVDEHTILWRWGRARCAAAGYEIDEGACDASRYWYVPGKRPGGTYELRSLTGVPLDVEKILASVGGSAAAPRHPLPGVHHHPSRAPAQRRAPTPAPRARKEVGAAARAPIPEFFAAAAARAAGLVVRPLNDGMLTVRCPWADSHTGGRDDAAVVIPPPTPDGWGLFSCRHCHCAHRTTLDLLDVLPHAALAAARRACGGGPMRARVVRAFVEHLDERPGGYGIAGQPAISRVVLRLVPLGVDLRRAIVDPVIVHAVKFGCEAHAALGAPTTDAAARALGGRVVQLTMAVVQGREVVRNISLVPVNATNPSQEITR
jgi:hypothetical protein